MAHQFHSVALREYDIRGRVGTEIGPADAHATGQSLGTLVRRAGGRRVLLGRDGRHSSPLLAEAAAAGLIASGCDVLDIGLGPTPMLYFALHDAGLALAADAGLMVTGSHNPADWNGFKLLTRAGPIHGPAIAALGAMAAAGDWETGAGALTPAPVLDAYVDRLAGNYRGGPFHAVWDAGNGAAGPVLERLLPRLPGRHRLIFGTVDGAFPHHHPDPSVAANLADLRAAVQDDAADLGFAFDGDADRIGAVDERGRIIWGDELIGLLAAPVLAALPGAAVVADVKSSQALFDRIAALGGRPVMWKSGHSLIKAKMHELGAPIGGEMTGHIMFGHRWHGVDDGILAGLRVMEALGETGQSLADFRDGWPRLVNSPELRMACPETRKFAVVAEVAARLAASGAAVNDIDGVRVQRPDGWWLLRASNTQAALTARLESRDLLAMARLGAELAAELALSGLKAEWQD